MASPLFGTPSNQNKFSSPNPFSADANKSTPSSSSYLPGFLLGNNNSPAPAFNRSLSTTGYQTNSPSKMSSKSPPRQTGYPYTSPIERKKKRTTTSNTSNQDGAPPTESLYSTHDIMSTSTNEIDMLKRDMLNSTSNEAILSKSMMNNSVFSPRPETIPQSPAQIDPFYSQGDAISSNDVLDDTAVTVFGFPPAASSFILQQFAQYGTVETHEIHNTGNWLHLKYQNKIQAKKALSKNGKIFARTIMTGVMPCIKKEIAQMESEMNNTTLPGTPNMSLNKTTSMRPLANSTSVRGSTPLTNDRGTPKKSDSVIGKALDYVFG